jgi:hypothetical protein
MDMKKILQALDSADAKPKVDANDMKKFVSIIKEGSGSLNRLTPAESIAVNHYTAPAPRSSITSPALNVPKDAKPSMVGKYFKQVEAEFKESQIRYNARANQLAERVTSRLNGVYGHKPSYSKNLARAQDPSAEIKNIAMQRADRNMQREESDAVDTVTMDVPLLIRLLEYAKEDAQTDMDLHNVAERLIELNKSNDVLSMTHYDTIVDGQPTGGEEPVDEVSTELLGRYKQAAGKQASAADKVGDFKKGDKRFKGIVKATNKQFDNDAKKVKEGLRDSKDNPCWKGYSPVGTTKKAGKTVPNCVKEGVAEGFNSKQEVINHFVKQGKTAAAGASAWERGWRGQTAKKKLSPFDPKYKPKSVDNSRYGEKDIAETRGLAEGYTLGKVLSFPEFIQQISTSLDKSNLNWKMSKRDDNMFLFSAPNDYNVWSMLVIEINQDGWVAVGHGIVDPDGEATVLENQELPMTLASVSEIAENAIKTYFDLDLSDYANEDDLDEQTLSLNQTKDSNKLQNK